MHLEWNNKELSLSVFLCDFFFQIALCEMQIALCELQIAVCELQMAFFDLRITFCELRFRHIFLL